MLNIMDLWEDSKESPSKRTSKDGLYWLFFVLWPLIGAALALIQLLDGSTLRPFLAFTVGLGAPTTLKSLMTTAARHAKTSLCAEE